MKIKSLALLVTVSIGLACWSIASRSSGTGLSANQSTERGHRIMPNDIAHFAIHADDCERAKKFYEEVFAPCFSDDLEQLLTLTDIDHSTTTIDAECDVTLLAGQNDDPELIRLLSFLTQADCRELSSTRRREFVDYYLSLSKAETLMIPHPATLFVL